MSDTNTPKSRKDLKELFSTGKIPTEEDFASVFDSSLNLQDDGIEKYGSTEQDLKFNGDVTVAGYCKLQQGLTVGDQGQVHIAVDNEGCLSINKNLNLSGTRVKNIAKAEDLHDAVNLDQLNNKKWVASDISDFDIQVRTSYLNQMSAPTESLDLNYQKVTNLANPSELTDAANKQYVDQFSKTKGTVTRITTGNGIVGGTITDTGTISLGTVPVNKLSGYPSNGTKVLHGDGSWKIYEGGVTHGDMMNYVNGQMLDLYYIITGISRPSKYSVTFKNQNVRDSLMWYVIPFGERISGSNPLSFQDNIAAVHKTGAYFDADYNLSIPDNLQGKSLFITTRVIGNMVKTSVDSRSPAVYLWYNFASSYRAIETEIPAGNFDIILKGPVPSGTSTITIQVGRDYPLTEGIIKTTSIECTITEV